MLTIKKSSVITIILILAFSFPTELKAQAEGTIAVLALLGTSMIGYNAFPGNKNMYGCLKAPYPKDTLTSPHFETIGNYETCAIMRTSGEIRIGDNELPAWLTPTQWRERHRGLSNERLKEIKKSFKL